MLIENSSYFRALLGGSFSESGTDRVRISCDLAAAVQVLRYLFEPPVSQAITHDNFLRLLEGALFLAVESLLVDCERWFRTVRSQISSIVVPLDFIIEVWHFAQKHGVTFVEDVCPGYLAQNFVHVISSRSFAQIPYDLLFSTIDCPHLTVDSEKQLCEAILYWISASMRSCELVPNSADSQLFLLRKVRVCLLPLEFVAGSSRAPPTSAPSSAAASANRAAATCASAATLAPPCRSCGTCSSLPRASRSRTTTSCRCWSEKQLCEAILYWVSASRQPCEQSVSNSADNQLSLLSKVRVCLLSLGFVAGAKRNCFEFGNNAVCTILNLLMDSLQTLLYTITNDNLDSYRIRLTEYSKKIVLSGCPQLTTQFLYISVLPTDLDAVFKRTIVSDVNYESLNLYNGLVKKAKTLSFRNVRIVDLSKCPNVHFGAAID